MGNRQYTHNRLGRAVPFYVCGGGKGKHTTHAQTNETKEEPRSEQNYEQKQTRGWGGTWATFVAEASKLLERKENSAIKESTFDV